MYIKITQDGIGRMGCESSPQDVAGLFTEGLETCAAVILFGTEKIVLIHDTGRMSSDTFKRELAWLGALERWTVVYNAAGPAEYPGRFNEHMEHLQEVGLPMECYEFSADLSKHHNASFVVVNRDRTINIKTKPNVLKSIPKISERHWVNFLNNYFSAYTKRFVLGDLQFDGLNITEAPILVCSLTEMRRMAIQEADGAGQQQLENYIASLDFTGLKTEGDRYYGSDEFDKAVDFYDAALLRYANTADIAKVYFNLGMSHRKCSRLLEALTAFDAAIARNPSYVKAWYHKAQVLYEQKKYTEALEAAEQGFVDHTANEYQAFKRKCSSPIQAGIFAPSPPPIPPALAATSELKR